MYNRSNTHGIELLTWHGRHALLLAMNDRLFYIEVVLHRSCFRPNCAPCLIKSSSYMGRKMWLNFNVQ